jgi:hypothetical protein
VAKEKSAKVSLIEAENEANNELLASFSTKISGNLAIFTRHLTRAKVSIRDFNLSFRILHENCATLDTTFRN